MLSFCFQCDSGGALSKGWKSSKALESKCMENHLWFMVVTRLQNLRDSSTCRQLEGGGGIERRERGGEREKSCKGCNKKGDETSECKKERNTTRRLRCERLGGNDKNAKKLVCTLKRIHPVPFFYLNYRLVHLLLSEPVGMNE